MSLTKQLILAIALLMGLAFVGSFLVSSLSAKHYLEDQLLLKNIDNANSLAASLSQMPKDPVSVELLISAYFDTGHYQFIRLFDPDGNLILEKVSDAGPPDVPEWFVSLLDLDARPANAQIQDGWTQYGSLRLASHNRFAYRELWRSMIRLLLWFLAGAAISSLAGASALRLITRPLRSVVAQAEAIGERRFVTTPEPSTTEFKAVVRSMNSLSRRVRHMLEEEAVRLEALRREAHYDQVTLLLNRNHFNARVEAMLQREDEYARGTLLIVRLMNLTELNRTQGWAVMDSLIKRLAEAMVQLAPEGEEWVCGRLNGTDFALLAPGGRDPVELAQTLSESMVLLSRELGLESACAFPIGATSYFYLENLAALLARADAALVAAVNSGGSAVQIADITEIPVAGEPSRGPATFADWRELLEEALTHHRLKLDSYPVTDNAGRILHSECAARVRLHPDAEWLRAGEFMPWLIRAGMGMRLDEHVIELALERLRHGSSDLCINLSASTMRDAGRMQKLAHQLREVPDLSARLWLEVPEYGVFRHLESFRVICALLKPVGVRVGIEHVGHQIAHIGELHDLGLDYVKVDSSFVCAIDQSQANQVYLRGLAMIAHSIGLAVYAEGVGSEPELSTLVELGFDGATGPIITALSD